MYTGTNYYLDCNALLDDDSGNRVVLIVTLYHITVIYIFYILQADLMISIAVFCNSRTTSLL